ncbi:ABC transporter substrate-binding protein [Paenibacillus nasutitermitis]|uniref:ABC transporter substrate-binding protein n=2 Tax=Paenibacillus nasutitermitis TaxID=1652958 RepID=A0A917E0D9_9BACL|nr:ABC transporter substrate-binding protein [Paenibacillus nasutitermitis]
MSKRLNRTVLLIVIMVVATTMLYGCTSSSDKGEKDSTATATTGAENGKPLITYKVLARGIDKPRSSTEDEVGKIIQEKFNVVFEYVPYNETASDKALLMLAANDWGDLDIVTTGIDAVTKKYIEADAFLKLDDYKDIIPNFFEYEKDLIPYWRNLDAKNGDLYIWQSGPDQLQMTSEPLDMNVRVDVLEELGWPKLDTTDDYINFLREAVKKFPTSLDQKSIGMINFWGEAYGPLLATYLPRHSGYQHFYKTTGFVDVEAKKIIPLASHPYLKETLKFWNVLSREGIMDREAWTDKSPEFVKKWESGVALSANFAKWNIPSINAKLALIGHPEMQYIVTPIRLSIAKEEGKNVRYELFNGVRPDETTGILKTAKEPERLLEVLNFMSSEEMTIRLGWGIEGRDYTINEEGLRIPTPELLEIVKSGDPDKQMLKRFGSYVTVFPTRTNATGPNGQANYFANDTQYLMAAATDTQKKAYAAYGWDTMLEAWHNNSEFKFVPFDITPYASSTNLDPELKEAKMEEKIMQYMDKQIPLVINANDDAQFEKLYNDMVKKVDELGQQQVVDKYNEQLVGFQVRIQELTKK